MPPEQRDATDPLLWLRRAHGNLTVATEGRNLPDVFFEDLCFQAQQAAEKALKAVLIHRKKGYPKTHAIMQLLSLLQNSGLDIPEQILKAGILTRYAVVTRYPGPAQVTKEEYVRAVKLAGRVLYWVSR